MRPSFSVSQNADRADLLFVIRDLWQCGFIRPDRSDKTLKFEVRNINDLVARVLPHFREHPLMSSKQRDVVRFDRICQLVHEGKHLEREGFEEIVRVAMEMNPSGKRRYTAGEIGPEGSLSTTRMPGAPLRVKPHWCDNRPVVRSTRVPESPRTAAAVLCTKVLREDVAIGKPSLFRRLGAFSP